MNARTEAALESGRIEVMMLSFSDIRETVLPIARKYDVKHLEIFGSFASNTERPDSDVDFLVEFASSVPSIFKVMGFREELVKALGVSVDVVTLPLARPEMLRIDSSRRIL